jgi:NADPH:quinone reductase-like Zn-dependent oxidoreductase
VTGRRLRPVVSKEDPADLRALAELLEAGTITPVVGRTYPLADAAEAIRELERGHATGKLVITI